MNAHITEHPHHTMRKALTAFFAWATLAAGSIVLMAVSCWLVNTAMNWINPEILEITKLKVYLGMTLVLSPVFVLLVLNWFKGGMAPKGPKDVQTHN